MWDFRRFAPKTGSRERGKVGDHLPIICDHMGQCGIPPFPVQSESGLTPIREWCLFSLPLTPLSSTLLRSFNEPGDGRFWPSSTEPNVPPGCNECCMPRHHSWTLQGWIRHTKRFFPRCLAKEDQVWCRWECVAKRRRRFRLDYMYFLFFCGFFCLYIHIINDSYIAYFCSFLSFLFF